MATARLWRDVLPREKTPDLILSAMGKPLASRKVKGGEMHNLKRIHKMQPDREENGQEEGWWEKSVQRSW